MQLLKHFNRKIYISLIVFGLLLLSSQLQAMTISSNSASAEHGKPVTFSSVIQVTGTAAGGGSVTVLVDYGDGSPEVTLYSQNPATLGTIRLTSSHIYSKFGSYTVQLKATTTVSIAVTGANPAYMTQAVSQLSISRIKIFFENNRPEITIQRNQKAPGLFAKIDYSGKGYFKGYWEIDGKRRGYVFKNLSKGPSVTLKYPDVPPLPTFNFGTHNVRFVVTNPAMNINFPYGIYFVTSDEALAKPITIKLLQPAEGEDIAYNPTSFKWEQVKASKIYLISIFSKSKEEKIFSAYTRQGSYDLRSSVLKTRMKPGEEYIWNVVGFNEENEVAAESTPSAFSFNQETAFLPGQILFITKPNDQGRKIIQEAKAKYGLEILQTYPVKILGLQVTKFHTDKDISGIIKELKKKKGVVAAQPNYIFKTMSEPNDEPLNELQSIRKIIKVGSDVPFKGKGITLGIIDTGVDLEHKDLKTAISSHVNCLTDSEYKPEIHGTAVAGLIGARKNHFGIDGYAPESTMFVVRACKQISATQPRGECYSDSISRALDLCIQNGVQIVNMSLGTNVEDKLISKLIDAGSKQGILFVAPAGNNSGITKVSFPASHPKVISVAGITEQGEFFPNDKVAKNSDFSLPCENLFSTTPNDKHNFLSGTSLSSAVVSGLLALASEKNNGLVVKNIQSFDGDINQWMNKYLMSKAIATQDGN